MPAEFVEFMRDWVNDLDRDFVPIEEAEKLVAAAREKRPEALEEWLHGQAIQHVQRYLQSYLKTQRGNARRATLRDFLTSVEEAEGDIARLEEAVSLFHVTYTIDGEDTRRRVADMTGADHQFVANGYRESARRDLLLEAFHRKVASLVGEKRTADVLTEEQYSAQLRSILTKSAA